MWDPRVRYYLSHCSLLTFVLVTGQQPPKNKRPKEPGENRIKPTNKKVKPKIPKIKDRDAADATPKAQSIMIHMMDKGRFQKPAATLSLTAGQTLELRCKGSKIEWSYPTYLDTFKDSRLRWALTYLFLLALVKGLVLNIALFLPSTISP